VRKTFDYFPAHVRREDLPNHLGVSARLIKTAHDGNVFSGHFHGLVAFTCFPLTIFRSEPSAKSERLVGASTRTSGLSFNQPGQFCCELPFAHKIGKGWHAFLISSQRAKK
jgi:hypothetical protein